MKTKDYTITYNNRIKSINRMGYKCVTYKIVYNLKNEDNIIMIKQRIFTPYKEVLNLLQTGFRIIKSFKDYCLMEKVMTFKEDTFNKL